MIPSFFKKRRRIFLLFTGCALAAILLTLLWPRDREPQYQGKPLTQWLLLYCYNAGPGRPQLEGRAEAVHAIRQIGTNALPFLLRAIQHETPAWKVLLSRVAPNLPPSVRASRTLRRLLEDKAARRADLVMICFDVLGSDAASARPELFRLSNNNKAPQTAHRAWVSAALVGMHPLDEPRASLDQQAPQAKQGAQKNLSATNASP